MLPVIVTKIIQETPDTKTFFIERADQQALRYKAGQFITLSINRNGKELRRSYSLSTAPETDEEIAFTVKFVTNGEVSRYLHRTIEVGSILMMQEATGRFTFEPLADLPRDIFLIAAGSGVTPVFSLLKKITSIDSSSSVNLILQNRSEQLSVFYNDFHRLVWENSKSLRLFEFLSNPANKALPSRRLNNEILEELLLDEMRFNRNRAVFYICGPLSFMRMAEFTIRQLGFASDQIKKEIFEMPRPAPPPFRIDPSPRNIHLLQNGISFSIPVQFPETILDAALRHHVQIPYSCKAGICGSCVMKCSSGQVKMKSNEVLTDEEVAGGLVLTCVGYAETDIELS